MPWFIALFSYFHTTSSYVSIHLQQSIATTSQVLHELPINDIIHIAVMPPSTISIPCSHRQKLFYIYTTSKMVVRFSDIIYTVKSVISVCLALCSLKARWHRSVHGKCPLSCIDMCHYLFLWTHCMSSGLYQGASLCLVFNPIRSQQTSIC